MTITKIKFKEMTPVAGPPTAIAERYGVTSETIRRKIREGTLPASKYGNRCWLIKFEDADRVFLK